MSDQCRFFEDFADTQIANWLVNRHEWDEENDLGHCNHESGNRTFSRPPHPVNIDRSCVDVDIPNDIDIPDDIEVPISFDLPDKCPHEPVADELCQFHLPIHHRKKDLHNISTKIADKISSGTTDERNFCGAILPELDLSDYRFEHLSTEAINFRFARVEGDIDLSGASFHQKLRFDYTICDEFNANNTVFNWTISAEHMFIYGDLNIAQCKQKKVMSFNNSNINGSVFGQNSVHSGRFGFANVIVNNNSDFSRTEFENMSVFNASRFGGKSEFTRTKFEETAFGSGGISGEQSLPGATFFDTVEFSNCEWEGMANFSEVDFLSYTKFNECVFKQNARFVQLWSENGLYVFDCDFHHFARFEQGVFTGPTRFLRTLFKRKFDLSDSVFTGTAHFDHISSESPISLAIDNVEAQESIKITQCFSFYDIHISHSQFDADVILDRTTVLKQLSINESTIDNLSIKSIRSPHSARFSGTTVASGEIDIRYLKYNSQNKNKLFDSEELLPASSSPKTLFTETISQELQNLIDKKWDDPMSEWISDDQVPDEPVDIIPSYEFPNGTFGDIDLLRNENSSQDQIRFYQTGFDNFRFDTHSDLFGSSWILHTFRHNRPDNSRIIRIQSMESFVEYPENPDELRVTYLKAREGASQIGANEAASKLYRHEKRYQRKLLFQEATAENQRLKSRLDNSLRWGSNWLLNLSSGYGEKPAYTVMFSLGLIAAFSIVYEKWGSILNESLTVQLPISGIEFTISEQLIFSFQAFVNFLPGPPIQSAPSSLRLISSLETLTGAFVIALFVFTLTRALRR